MDLNIDENNFPEAIAIKRYEVDDNPSISYVDSATLKSGPRAYKRVSRFHIINSHTGEVHHDVIKIETQNKNKNGYTIDEEHTITIDDEKEDEISRLATFLCGTKNIFQTGGDYLIVPIGTDKLKKQAILQVVNAISSSDKVDSIAQLLSQIRGNPELLHLLAKRISDDPQASKEATAAFNFARFTTAVEKLEELIRADAREPRFQEHLSEYPWMFGSEYSELVDRRKFTTDEQQDFMVRRTADGCLEMIEIKTPLKGKALFIYDNSHETYYPSTEISKVLGQVTNYLEKLDGERNTINYNVHEDVTKIRAKIIIGQDGDEGQQKALRRLNGHLHRIEILTFDQLLRIAKQVVKHQEQVLLSLQE